jgi:murein L,D-transpeptidase YcbB/YkuD
MRQLKCFISQVNSRLCRRLAAALVLGLWGSIPAQAQAAPDVPDARTWQIAGAIGNAGGLIATLSVPFAVFGEANTVVTGQLLPPGRSSGRQDRPEQAQAAAADEAEEVPSVALLPEPPPSTEANLVLADGQAGAGRPDDGPARVEAALAVAMSAEPATAPLTTGTLAAAMNAPALRLDPPDLPEAVPSLVLPKSSEDTAFAAALLLVLAEKGGFRHPRLDRKMRQAIATAYEARGFKPFWLDGENWTAAARAAMARLRLADEDGLDPAAYAMPEPAAGPSPAERIAILAGADLRLSVAVVLYARDARGGRIDARRLSAMIDPTLRLPEPAGVLAEIAASPAAGAALQAYNPPHEGYRRLRAKLAELRRSGVPVASPVPPGVDLRIGMSDPRVPALRERFGVAPLSDANYDDDVARAVAAFQRAHGLPATGTLNRQTVAALRSASADQLVPDIIANMERWRWLPADLGLRHLIVNVPDFQVRLIESGRIVHESRVIVGKPDTPTPIFSDEMSFLVVNPSWFVPPSILKKEFLPKMASDPDYAARRGYEVVRRGSQVSIRQPPGERNALGHIKFMFPNRHAVYLHDTPSRNLFGTERRAYSHGCVRVDNPFRLAELVMDEAEWTERRLRGMVGQGERSLKMKRKLPIHLVYFTHSVDADGRLSIRDDLYGYHRRVRSALGLGG